MIPALQSCTARRFTQPAHLLVTTAAKAASTNAPMRSIQPEEGDRAIAPRKSHAVRLSDLAKQRLIFACLN